MWMRGFGREAPIAIQGWNDANLQVTGGNFRGVRGGRLRPFDAGVFGSQADSRAAWGTLARVKFSDFGQGRFGAGVKGMQRQIREFGMEKLHGSGW